MAYTVAQRTRETGIRRALGAEAARIVGRVAGHGLRLTGLGLAVGGLVAFQVMGLMEGYLHHLEPHDPLTLALSATLLAVASMTACVVPALRATRVDPLLFLRAE
jgi:ABC-type antimicrobial peptide transport system permease subunit